MSLNKIETNTIYCGDCLELMGGIKDESVDLILADLPYGTTKCSWDIIIPFKPLWEHYERIIKPNGAILLFAQTPFDKVLGSSKIDLLRYEWIWEKTQATGHLNSKKMPMKAHENILVFYKKLPTYNPQKTQGHKPVNSYYKSIDLQNKTEIYGKVNKELSGGGNTDRFPRDILRYASEKQTCKLHPTQKPVPLLEYLIKTYTHEGETVVDNVAGSFSTAEACENTNRKWICMDKEISNCSIGKVRLENKYDIIVAS